MGNTNTGFVHSMNPNIRFKNIQEYEDLTSRNTQIEKIMSEIKNPSQYDVQLLSDNTILNSEWKVVFIPFKSGEIYGCLILNKDASNKKDIKNYVNKFFDLKLNIKPTEYSSGEAYESCKKYLDFRLPLLLETQELLEIYSMTR
jgi:thioredoxin-related protein